MGAKGRVQATWSALSAGGHFHVERKKLSGEQRDGWGHGRCQERRRRLAGPGLETKIIEEEVAASERSPPQ